MLLLDPVLASGETAAKAIEVLKAHGVPEKNIIFLTIVASEKVCDTHNCTRAFSHLHSFICSRILCASPKRDRIYAHANICPNIRPAPNACMNILQSFG